MKSEPHWGFEFKTIKENFKDNLKINCYLLKKKAN